MWLDVLPIWFPWGLSCHSSLVSTLLFSPLFWGPTGYCLSLVLSQGYRHCSVTAAFTEPLPSSTHRNLVSSSNTSQRGGGKAGIEGRLYELLRLKSSSDYLSFPPRCSIFFHFFFLFGLKFKTFISLCSWINELGDNFPLKIKVGEWRKKKKCHGRF